jgi:hypothetical protein
LLPAQRRSTIKELAPKKPSGGYRHSPRNLYVRRGRPRMAVKRDGSWVPL